MAIIQTDAARWALGSNSFQRETAGTVYLLLISYRLADIHETAFAYTAGVEAEGTGSAAKKDAKTDTAEARTEAEADAAVVAAAPYQRFLYQLNRLIGNLCNRRLINPVFQCRALAFAFPTDRKI